MTGVLFEKTITIIYYYIIIYNIYWNPNVIEGKV